MLISPLSFLSLKNAYRSHNNGLYNYVSTTTLICGGIIVICISSVLTNYTVISDIYGGGGKLGGGSLLIEIVCKKAWQYILCSYEYRR